MRPSTRAESALIGPWRDEFAKGRVKNVIAIRTYAQLTTTVATLGNGSKKTLAAAEKLLRHAIDEIPNLTG